MKTILRLFAIVVLASGCGSLFADGDGRVIHPGDPQVHPGYVLTVPSFDKLIPTTYPLIQAGEPAVHPWQNLTHSINNPLIPKGAN